MAIKAIIIDDEHSARLALANALEKYCPDVHLVAEGHSVESGFNTILKHDADVIFLDVKMGDGSGFDLLGKLRSQEVSYPPVIFVTAYGHFAIKAFEFSALDYLLKPLESRKLIASVKRLEPKDQMDNFKQKIDELFNYLDPKTTNTSRKIVLNTSSELFFVKPEEIIRCEAQINYSIIILTQNRQILVAKSIKEYEKMLAEFNFFRCHKSHLINFEHIVKIKRGTNSILSMSDGSQVQLASNRKSEFLRFINRTKSGQKNQ